MRFDLIASTIAALAGVMMAFQGTMNSALSKVVGLWETSFFVHATGVAVLAAGLLLKTGFGNMKHLIGTPWHLLLGGPLGVLIIYGVARSIPKIGAAPATTCIIIGQVLSACLIDHFGLFGLKPIALNWYKFLGIAFLALGGWLVLKE